MNGVNAGLGREQVGRAHLYRNGTQRKGGGNATTISDAAWKLTTCGRYSWVPSVMLAGSAVVSQASRMQSTRSGFVRQTGAHDLHVEERSGFAGGAMRQTPARQHQPGRPGARAQPLERKPHDQTRAVRGGSHRERAWLQGLGDYQHVLTHGYTVDLATALEHE